MRHFSFSSIRQILQTSQVSFFGAIILLFSTSCEGFWGTKTDTDFLDEPIYDSRTVAYVPIQPVWDNLVYPIDVIAGWDELIYVADSGTQEIVSFDQAGNELGRYFVQDLSAIAQDRRLDLLAAGTRDTVINGTPYTLPAIYRLDLNKTGDYGLSNASLKRLTTHPFYFKSGTPTGSDSVVRFTGIAPLSDNRYYVTRTGPSNFVNQFGGPNDAVILFTGEDNYQIPVSVNTNLGLFRNYFVNPQAITSLAVPPQSPSVTSSGDFMFCSGGEGNLLKVQLIRFVDTEFGSSYEVVNLAAGDTSRADRFLYEPGRFIEPSAVTTTGDGTNYFFVLDAEKDSLYQFNGLGFEGVNPPPGANGTKVIRASFGGTGEGLTQFREPRGVAYLNRIVYVADAGNSRVLRFKLTTDFD
ncbi:MAG: hypothetical protein AAF587_18145 [Bacteroidota bacterium]